MGATSATASRAYDFDQLDELAKLPTGPDPDGRILALVERVAERPEERDELVRRYATAPNTLVPRAVSFVLAQIASHPSPDTWSLIRRFAGQALGSPDPSTSINVLTAVGRLVRVDPNTRPTSAEPELAEFILRSLAGPPLVRAVAMDLLGEMATDGTLQPFFPRDVAHRLRRIIQHLVAAGEFDERDGRDVLAALQRAP